jgi:hypothetical protein
VGINNRWLGGGGGDGIVGYHVCTTLIGILSAALILSCWLGEYDSDDVDAVRWWLKMARRSY